MGMVFGRTGTAEPVYDVLYKSTGTGTTLPYEIRKYGERFAAETSWISKSDGSSSSSSDNDNDSPFKVLAQYIGVFGTPQNEGQVSIAMTAPVMKEQQEQDDITNKPVQIAMTAPVMMSSTTEDSSNATNTIMTKKMMFVLPEQYKSLSTIPKPTNPAVTIVTIPSQAGAVYQYSGSMNDQHAYDLAIQLGHQLQKDGVPSFAQNDATAADLYTKNHYQFWGYSPPFTLPMYRRNEIWIDLTQDDVDAIVNKGQTPLATDAN